MDSARTSIGDGCGVPEHIREELFEPFVITKEEQHEPGSA